jgi:hypothetical protein
LKSRLAGDTMVITHEIFIVEFRQKSKFLFRARVTTICHPLNNEYII